MDMNFAEEAQMLAIALVGCHVLSYAITRDHLASHALPQFVGFTALAVGHSIL